MFETDDIFTVHEITEHIRNILESYVSSLNCIGEVTNISRPNSGHIYFSLKDEKALIRCVWFSGFGKHLDFIPKNGDKVVISGKITLYSKDGQYQILVSRITKYGVGLLHERFEKLKEKLKLEGLFEECHKKDLPIFPKSIAIITSETGAAIQDMLKVINSRYPLKIFLYPAIVQGDTAADSLTNGIKYFSTNKIADVIIIGRGGGSFEDLFCFNDESLIRAIYKCPIPVISAVGHETDFTLCDFVADKRAATPSVAAMMATPNQQELLKVIYETQNNLNSIVKNLIARHKQQLIHYKLILDENTPEYIINQKKQNLDYIYLKLSKHFDDSKSSFIATHELMKERLIHFTNRFLDKCYAKLKHAKLELELNSPESILTKGYAIVIKENKAVSSKDAVIKDDTIDIKFKDGKVTAIIK